MLGQLPLSDIHDPSPKSILIADDETTLGETLSEMLGRWIEKPIGSVQSGEALLEAVRSGDYRMVLTDMNMPGLCGTQLVQQLRAEQPEIGIIVMTGYVEEFPYIDVIKAGADDFIRKPFLKDELRAKLDRLFREQDVRYRQHRAEQKYRSLFQMSHEGMLVLDAETYVVEDANPAFAGLCGRAVETLPDVNFMEFFSERDGMRLQAWLGACSQMGRGTLADIQLKGKGGAVVYADISVTFITAGDDGLIYATFKDVTERREVEAKLADAAQKDELTGLFNKRTYHQRLDGAVQRATQNPAEARMSLLLIDLDNFKRCNDTYGHQIGDKLLISVGDAVHASIRTSDFGFRCGGDEFSVLLMGIPPEGAIRVAERMQEEFAKHESYGTTMSIGIASFDPERDASSDTLIRRADEALYRAKRGGKNMVELAV
jgi:diguanylate cyclase (GGDEF)-like protein/PAS domain S-box-containing protein